jgi:molybdopterin converting factor small subunit
MSPEWVTAMADRVGPSSIRRSKSPHAFVARATTESVVSNPAGRRCASKNPGQAAVISRGVMPCQGPASASRRRSSLITSVTPSSPAMISAVSDARDRSLDATNENIAWPPNASERPIAWAWRRPSAVSGESAMPCQRFTAFHSLWPCRMSKSELSARCIPTEATGAGTMRAVAIVRLFASARQTAGTGRDELPGRTVAEVLDAARDRYGVAFEDVLATCRIWVNGESVGDQTVIGPHDEVAILPPVSGGSW